MSRTVTLRKLALFFAVILILGCSSLNAQSGRRGPKTSPTPVPIPAPEANPEPAKSSENSKGYIRFIVGIDQHDSFSTITLSTAGGVQRSFSQRLDEPDWAKVDSSRRDMSRSEAIKLAKTEKDTYVVLLRIREDTMGSRNPGTANNDYNNAYVEYTVFTPGAAKVFATGSTYPPTRRGVILNPRTSGTDGDYYLNRAARDAADHVLSKFSIPINR